MKFGFLQLVTIVKFALKEQWIMMQFLIGGALLGGVLISAGCNQSAVQTENFGSQFSTYNTMVTDTATFGSGCFWCTEAIFQQLDGVLKVTSGYSGGTLKNPTYEQVVTKLTGHAEVAQIIYDAQKISFDDLLEVFWKTHDPTTLNKQGNDEGPQYRSIIFYHNSEQQKKANYYKAELTNKHAFENPIVTTIEPYKEFYVADDKHQNFYSNNPNYGYCNYVIKPKLEEFEEIFQDKLRKKSTAN